MNLMPWRHKAEERGGRETTLPALRRQIDDLFEQFYRDPFGAGLDLLGNWGGGLRTDLSETDDQVLVRIELPGVDPNEVDINITGGTLSISGEKKEERDDKERNYHYVERRFGRFQRDIQLPGYVDPDQVDATFKNGILTVSIAKRPDAMPKKIKVTSA